MAHFICSRLSRLKPGSSVAQVKGRPVMSLHKQAGTHIGTHPPRSRKSEWKLKLKPHYPAANLFAMQVEACCRPFKVWHVNTGQNTAGEKCRSLVLSYTRRLLLWHIDFTLCHYHLYLEIILSGWLKFLTNMQRRLHGGDRSEATIVVFNDCYPHLWRYRIE